MAINPILMIIRTKKLGVLMRDARQAFGKSLEECAQALGISVIQLEAYELGQSSPSLPELEMLAFFLKVPLEHFWGNETMKRNGRSAQLQDPEQVKGLRQRMIGTLIRKARTDAGLSLEQMSEDSQVPVNHLEAYELGEQPIPIAELELLAHTLNTSMRAFQDQHGPAGIWFTQKQTAKEFSELSPDLQTFVCKPINRPYLEVAQRLSEMSVEKLRTVAEVLLEITL